MLDGAENGTSPFPPDAPLRALAEVDAPDGCEDRMLPVATARIAFLDHALLAHDLPSLADGQFAAAGHDSARAREAWLLDQAALISTAQAKQSRANTPIATSGSPRPGWRPPRYGRAVIVEATGEGGAEGGGPPSLLLDLKGAGRGPGQVPELAHHASGLCSLREALRELLFARLIAGIFRRAAPDLWTLPVYAVVDLGFDARTHRGEQLPAALLVRRAHRRSLDGGLPWPGSGGERLRLEIELLLRAYGVTSANAGTRFRLSAGEGLRVGYRDTPPVEVDAAAEPAVRAVLGGAREAFAEGNNIQLARIDARPGFRAQLVDFGHYEIRRSFVRALVSMVQQAPHLWGAVLRPSDPQFVQPHPDLAAALAGWAREQESAGFSTAPRAAVDPATRWADAVARGFRGGELTSSDIAAALTGLDPFVEIDRL